MDNSLILEFTYTISKGKNTKGMSICTLRIGNKVMARCKGRQYDMEATCLAKWIEEKFSISLMRIKKELDGLRFFTINRTDISKLPTELHVLPKIDPRIEWSKIVNILTSIGGTIKVNSMIKNKKTLIVSFSS